MVEIYEFFIAVFIACCIARLLSLRRRVEPQHYRMAESLLTAEEARFYQRLRDAVGPMAVIQCKVRLADILIAPEGDSTAFRKVSQKHVDFLLCERITLKPLVAVELDDSSHMRADRIERDRFVNSAYQSAGLKLIHIPTSRTYDSSRF